jgi:glycosyltransferase involved in cell wall biosynthesis
MTSPHRLCVISPCRDEEQFLARSVSSVLRQTESPTTWIVVDDGSTDRTPELLEELLDHVPWARVVDNPRTGGRVLGSGVVRAFTAGLAHVDLDDYDFVVKLDLDLDLPPGYFAGVLALMDEDPRLGSVSGKPFHIDGRGRLQHEINGDENSVGMAKLWRVAAYRDIGGLVPELMWDGIDCHQLRRNGWRVYSTADPALAFEHLRAMGASDRGVLRGRRRHGAGQYFMGTSPVFLVASAARRLLFPPAVLGSISMVVGYAWAALRRRPRLDDPGFIRDLRRYQRESLLLGKAEAVRRWERRVARERRADPGARAA